MPTMTERLLRLWERPLDGDAEAAFREVYADPVRVNGGLLPVSGLVERARALHTAYEGRVTELVDEIETPGRLVVGFRMRARHTGPLQTPLGTVPPTGREVVIRVTDILTVEDGLITDIWMVADELGLLLQLDAVRAAEGVR
ncbi:ester cyclase [Microbispora corallina]|nr:ester cyclase [Microbispora corallina]